MQTTSSHHAMGRALDLGGHGSVRLHDGAALVAAEPGVSRYCRQQHRFLGDAPVDPWAAPLWLLAACAIWAARLTRAERPAKRDVVLWVVCLASVVSWYRLSAAIHEFWGATCCYIGCSKTRHGSRSTAVRSPAIATRVVGRPFLPHRPHRNDSIVPPFGPRAALNVLQQDSISSAGCHSAARHSGPSVGRSGAGCQGRPADLTTPPVLQPGTAALLR